MAGSVRDNILFGCALDPDWYAKVVAACALQQDLAALPAGDMTELGERGINLSGGQKARVALARAAYCRADVVLLDDPLSAVDPHVGRTLFEQCIGPRGIMQGSTRVLVTHQRQYLPQCGQVMVLRRGRCVGQGRWQQLQELGLQELAAANGPEPPETPQLAGLHDDATKSNTVAANVAELGSQAGDCKSDRALSAQLVPPLPSANLSDTTSAASDAAVEVVSGAAQLLDQSDDHGGALGSEVKLVLTHATAPDMVKAKAASPAGKGPKGGKGLSARARAAAQTAADLIRATAAGRLVMSEGRAVGTVRWTVYLQYTRQLGSWASLLIVAVVLAAQASYLAGEWWLSIWSQTAPAAQSEIKWLWVYGLLTGLVVLFGTLRSFLFFTAAVHASTRMHDAMVLRVLRAPLAFFHTNPAGRILNRFSKDLGSVDDTLPVVIFDAIQCGLLVLGALILVAVAVPWVVPVFLPLALSFWFIRHRYIVASREIKRWEAVTRSPIYATFSATLKGLATIRAYSAQPRFQSELLDQLASNGHWSFAFSATGRWIGFRLDLIACTTLLAAALIAAAAREAVRPALLGLALSQLLQMTGIMQWFVRQSAEVENNMTCTERLLEYTQLPQEPPTLVEGAPAPPPGWPTSGALQFRGVSARYRPGLPPVLCDLTFTLKAGCTCGLVGRTGSGKSSLALVLFRLIEVTQGAVLLDGLDVASIGLDALRRQLAIIPQDPVLFSGSVRSNLDPWGRHPDEALWGALRAVQMQRAVQALGGLSGKIAEGGDSLSAGQRQLFCLARALLQEAKVLCLDEATANVDRGTDELIQWRSRCKCDPSRQPGVIRVSSGGSWSRSAEEDAVWAEGRGRGRPSAHHHRAPHRHHHGRGPPAGVVCRQAGGARASYCFGRPVRRCVCRHGGCSTAWCACV
ncbi:P-loop containing nucleoside triphosphate hydrolase protein [Haematococcus lacustris]